MILNYVTHYPKTNSLEVRWVEAKYSGEVVVEYVPIITRSYSSDQAAEFSSDLGPDAEKYLTMAGW